MEGQQSELTARFGGGPKERSEPVQEVRVIPSECADRSGFQVKTRFLLS